MKKINSSVDTIYFIIFCYLSNYRKELNIKRLYYFRNYDIIVQVFFYEFVKKEEDF